MQLGQYGIPRDIRSCILNGRDLGDVIPALREVSLCSLCIYINFVVAVVRFPV